jgi:hypothetical protein
LQFLNDSYLNLSIDTAISHVKFFLKHMSQPVDQEALQSVLLTVEEVKKMAPAITVGEVPGGGGAMITEASTLSM